MLAYTSIEFKNVKNNDKKTTPFVPCRYNNKFLIWYAIKSYKLHSQEAKKKKTIVKLKKTKNAFYNEITTLASILFMYPDSSDGFQVPRKFASTSTNISISKSHSPSAHI